MPRSWVERRGVHGDMAEYGVVAPNGPVHIERLAEARLEVAGANDEYHAGAETACGSHP
jgi:hypothetical protein